MADTDLLTGKWTVWVKDWVWEYEFFPDGTVTWRDTRSAEKGSGRWSASPQFINMSWTGSSTTESWKRPLSIVKQTNGWYNAPYYKGPYAREKVALAAPPLTLPGWSGPDDDVEIDVITNDPLSQPTYIDKLCGAVAYGIYNGGYWAYIPPAFTPYPIEIPERVLWFGASRSERVSDRIFDSQADALAAAGGANPDRIAYYWGVGGKVVCPTAFTLRTAPTIVNTASIVVDRLVEEVQRELIDIMFGLVLRIGLSTAGAIINRISEVRQLKVRDANGKSAVQRFREARQKVSGAPQITGGPAAERLQATALDLQGKNPGRAVEVLSSPRTFRHTITGDVPGVNYARIEMEGSMRLSTGANAHYGEGVYAWPAGQSGVRTYVDIEVPAGTGVETLDVGGQRWVRMVPPNGNTLPVKIVSTNRPQSQIDMGRQLLKP